MADWICLALPCLILIILIYYRPKSDIRVKSYARLNFPCASIFNFEHLDMFCSWIRKSSEKLGLFEFVESLICSISSVSIYYLPESDIRVKSYGCLNLPCASMFNFEHHDIFCSWVWHRSEILWLFEFLECFRCSILIISIYYWSESDIQVKSYAQLNFPCASIFNFDHLDIFC